MRYLIVLIAFLLVSLIGGCAPTMQQAAVVDSRLQANEGIVYGTVLVNVYDKNGNKVEPQKSRYTSISHSYTIFIGDPAKDLSKEALLGINATSILNAQLSEPNEVLFTRKVKEQEYSLTTRVFFPPEMTLFSSKNIWFEMPGNIHFNSATNKATYIGSIVITIDESKGYNKYPAIYFKIIDNYEQASQILRAKNPDLKLETTSNIMKWVE